MQDSRTDESTTEDAGHLVTDESVTFDTPPDVKSLTNDSENNDADAAKSDESTKVEDKSKDADDDFDAASGERDKHGDADDSKADDQKTDDGDDDAKDDDAEPAKDKTPVGVQKRIDKAVKKQKDAERVAKNAVDQTEFTTKQLEFVQAELDKWRNDVLNRDNAEGVTQEKVKVEAEPPEPKEEDFDNFDDFQEAKVDWRADKKAKAEVDKLRAELQAKDDKADADKHAAQRLTAKQEKEAKVAEQFDAARARHDDFDEVAKAKMSAPLYDTVIESPIAAEIAYHLGNNPDESARIAALSDKAMGIEIGMIQATIQAEIKAEGGSKADPDPDNESDATDDNPASKKKLTNTPEPIDTLNGGKSASRKAEADMSFKEYDAHRKKHPLKT